jgi:hypothetical protein
MYKCARRASVKKKNAGFGTKMVGVYMSYELLSRVQNVAGDEKRSISQMASILIEEAVALREADRT